MKRLVFDIEADGLVPQLTKMWVAVTYDLDTKETKVFSDYSKQTVNGGLDTFIEHIKDADLLVCHNLISYDLQAIKKLTGYVHKGEVLDTLLMSKLLKFNRRTPKGCRGAHGLEAWGLRTKIAKPSQAQWVIFEEAMLHRCKEDVKINTAVYLKLVAELEDQPEARKALKIEHDVARVTAKQVAHGWLLDTKKAKDNLVYLDKEIERLRAILEPQIPMRCVPKDAAATWEDVNKVMQHWDKVPVTRMDHKQKPIKPSRAPKKVKILKDGRYDKHTAQWFGITQESAWSVRDLVPNSFYSRIEYKEVKLSQHRYIKDFLLSIGWVPTEWNYKKGLDGKFLKDHEHKFLKASPKLTPDSFSSIPGSFGADFKRWATLTNRRLVIENPKDNTKGWINLRRPDGHVSCDPDTLGAATGRMIHRGIVNVPGTKSVFGREMRECFIAEEGRTLVGADAAGAQLRLLAAAMGDANYLDVVVNGEEEDANGNFKGTDVHTQNGVAAGLIKEATLQWLREHNPSHTDWHKHHEDFFQGRAKAKTFIYALLFGAGNQKIGSVVGGGAKEGKKLRDSFLAGFPKLGQLIKRLEGEWEGNKRSHFEGFIKGLDGRRVYVDSPHKLLNYKLQGDEAIFVKYMMVLADQLLVKNSVDANLLLVMHDEANYSVALKDVERTKEVLVHSFIRAGEHLGLLCKMESTPLTGANWAEIH